MGHLPLKELHSMSAGELSIKHLLIELCKVDLICSQFLRCRLVILFIAVQVIHVLSSPRASLPKKSAVTTPHKRDRHEYHCETSKKGSRPLVAQFREKTMRKKRKARAEKVANEADSSQC